MEGVHGGSNFDHFSELIARGIDVNAVRQMLRDLGDLAHSEPLIGSDGGVAFVFVIVSQVPDAEILSIAGDGITVEEYRPELVEEENAAHAPAPLLNDR